MGYVNKRTCFCESCDIPTMHNETMGIEDGEFYSILHCSKCGLRLKPVKKLEGDPLIEWDNDI
jgi:hypothetical protein